MKTFYLLLLLVGTSLSLPQTFPRRRVGVPLPSGDLSKPPSHFRAPTRQTQPFNSGGVGLPRISPISTVRGSTSFRSRPFTVFRESAEDIFSREQDGLSHFMAPSHRNRFGNFGHFSFENDLDDLFSSEFFDFEDDDLISRMSLGRRFHPLGVPKRTNPVNIPTSSVVPTQGNQRFSNPHIHIPSIARFLLDDSFEIDDDSFESGEGLRTVLRLSPNVRAFNHEIDGERLALSRDILNQYNFVDVQGTTNWGYKTNNQFQEHQVHKDGTMKGEFGWTAPEGSEVTIKYIADKGGYRVISSVGTYQRESDDVISARKEHLEAHAKVRARFNQEANQKNVKGINIQDQIGFGVPLPAMDTSQISPTGRIDSEGGFVIVPNEGDFPLINTALSSGQLGGQQSTFGVPLPKLDQGGVSVSHDQNIDEFGGSGVPLPPRNLGSTTQREKGSVQGSSIPISGSFGVALPPISPATQAKPGVSGTFGVPLPKPSSATHGTETQGASIPAGVSRPVGVPLPKITSLLQENRGPLRESTVPESGISGLFGVPLPTSSSSNTRGPEKVRGTPLPATGAPSSIGVPLPEITSSLQGNKGPLRGPTVPETGVSGTIGVPLPPHSSNQENKIPFQPESPPAIDASGRPGSFGVPLPPVSSDLENKIPFQPESRPAIDASGRPGSFGVPLPPISSDQENKVSSQQASLPTISAPGRPGSFGVPIPTTSSDHENTISLQQESLPAIGASGPPGSVGVPLPPISRVPLPPISPDQENKVLFQKESFPAIGASGSFGVQLPTISSSPQEVQGTVDQSPITVNAVSSSVGVPLPTGSSAGIQDHKSTSQHSNVGVPLSAVEEPIGNQGVSDIANTIPFDNFLQTRIIQNVGIPLTPVGSDQFHKGTTQTFKDSSIAGGHTQLGVPLPSSSPSVVPSPIGVPIGGSNIGDEVSTRGFPNSIGVPLPSDSSASQKKGRADSEITQPLQNIDSADKAVGISLPAQQPIELSLAKPLDMTKGISIINIDSPVEPSQQIPQIGVSLPAQSPSQPDPGPNILVSELINTGPSEIFKSPGVSLPAQSPSSQPDPQANILVGDSINIGPSEIFKSPGVSLPAQSPSSQPDSQANILVGDSINIGPSEIFKSPGVQLPANLPSDFTPKNQEQITKPAFDFGVPLPTEVVNDPNIKTEKEVLPPVQTILTSTANKFGVPLPSQDARDAQNIKQVSSGLEIGVPVPSSGGGTSKSESNLISPSVQLDGVNFPSAGIPLPAVPSISKKVDQISAVADVPAAVDEGQTIVIVLPTVRSVAPKLKPISRVGVALPVFDSAKEAPKSVPGIVSVPLIKGTGRFSGVPRPEVDLARTNQITSPSRGNVGVPLPSLTLNVNTNTQGKESRIATQNIQRSGNSFSQLLSLSRSSHNSLNTRRSRLFDSNVGVPLPVFNRRS